MARTDTTHDSPSNDASPQQPRDSATNGRGATGRLCCINNDRFLPGKCATHIQVTVIAVSLCVVLGVFVVYDLVQISRFMSKVQKCASSDIRDLEDYNTSDGGRGRRFCAGMSASAVVRQYDAYQRQRALAITLLVLLMVQVSAAAGVWLGYRRRQSALLLPFLIVTFPILTLAMVYAILFRTDGAGAIVYVKIITIVIIYTILANIFRAVYRMYRFIKYRCPSSRSAHAYGHDIGSVSGGLEPVVLRMKPPPYEREPPPYSLEKPDISVPPYAELAPPMETETVFAAVHSNATVHSNAHAPSPGTAQPGHVTSSTAQPSHMTTGTTQPGHVTSAVNIGIEGQPPAYETHLTTHTSEHRSGTSMIADSTGQVHTNDHIRASSLTDTQATGGADPDYIQTNRPSSGYSRAPSAINGQQIVPLTDTTPSPIEPANIARVNIPRSWRT